MLVKNTEPINACGIYATAFALDCQIEIFWPRIMKEDNQSKYMAYVYNEGQTKWKLPILWANSARPDLPYFSEKLFVSNHFSILCNKDLSLNRTKGLENRVVKTFSSTTQLAPKPELKDRTESHVKKSPFASLHSPHAISLRDKSDHESKVKEGIIKESSPPRGVLFPIGTKHSPKTISLQKTTDDAKESLTAKSSVLSHVSHSPVSVPLRQGNAQLSVDENKLDSDMNVNEGTQAEQESKNARIDIAVESDNSKPIQVDSDVIDIEGPKAGHDTDFSAEEGAKDEQCQEEDQGLEQVEVLPDLPMKPIKYQFKRWDVLLDAALETKVDKVLHDLKDYAGKDKDGQILVVDYSRNRKRHLDGNTIEWNDFEGQWNGKKSKPVRQVFTRANSEEPLKLDSNYTYDMKIRQVFKITKDKVLEPVSDEFYLNALVLIRYKTYHGLSLDYQRKITFFRSIPSDMDKKLLNLATYEYRGQHPGYKPHENRKVS